MSEQMSSDGAVLIIDILCSEKSDSYFLLLHDSLETSMPEFASCRLDVLRKMKRKMKLKKKIKMKMETKTKRKSD